MVEMHFFEKQIYLYWQYGISVISVILYQNAQGDIIPLILPAFLSQRFANRGFRGLIKYETIRKGL